MNLLQIAIQDFITQHLNSNINELALKKNPFPTEDYSSILNQISAKKKAQDKLPTWFNTPNIIYPAKISIEQTSSETTAKYKASLIYGSSLIDLTGGFGVDAYFFAKNIKNIIHCEQNEELSNIAKHNFEQFQANNITCIAGDGLEILQTKNQTFDWIYIDPSRRNDKKGKVFLLKDCLPNVPALMHEYFKFSNSILIKTAPILDITSGINELQFVKEIHIVSVKNEVKELLWKIEKNYTETISIFAINIENECINIEESIYKEKYETTFQLPQTYLYEPNSSLMKSGNVDVLCHKYSIDKLHTHSHLFTSNNKIDFPGRRFKIDEIIPFQKEHYKKLEKQKINIAIRNFPLTVDALKKKLKIKDGGIVFAFFTTNFKNEKIVLLCTKI